MGHYFLACTVCYEFEASFCQSRVRLNREPTRYYGRTSKLD